MDTGTRIKIGGITNWGDAEAAVDAGADMLGFVCDENSPRVIDPDDFFSIASRLPRHVQKVGVFDRTTDPRWRTGGRGFFEMFDLIQYYQDSLWTDIIRENWDMRRKIKAFHLTGQADLRRIAGFNGLVQSFLLNVHLQSPPAPRRGSGTGGEQDDYGWELAREIHQYGKRLFLAGGLTPENVARAIVRVRPYAVDVTVGVEAAPGVKDHARLGAFIQAARGA